MKKETIANLFPCSYKLYDAYWGGKKHDGGRGAKGKIPFVAAVSTNEKGHPLQFCFTQVDSFSKDAIKSWAQKHLTPGCKLVSDGLGCFQVFKEISFDQTTIVTSGGPESVEIRAFKWINTIIGNIKNSIHGTFHAISKKHFSRYSAELCYCFNRRFDLGQMIPRFGYIGVRTPPMSQRLLKMTESHG